MLYNRIYGVALIAFLIKSLLTYTIRYQKNLPHHIPFIHLCHNRQVVDKQSKYFKSEYAENFYSSLKVPNLSTKAQLDTKIK